MIWDGVGFKSKNGKWPSAFLFARCLLVSADMTIPRPEIVTGSNMLWLVCQILSEWMESFILVGDAHIPLFLVLSKINRLSL